MCVKWSRVAVGLERLILEGLQEALSLNFVTLMRSVIGWRFHLTGFYRFKQSQILNRIYGLAPFRII